ncbi:MAG: NAD-dependent epimerase/dehydratase family protein [Deltaproteobacteria bacterium]|nr:NAD-dependent epimerase/dehydratase family protein [Deltaproteobacteria bacterium]
MKVLVTGGTGFFGSHIVKALRGAGHETAALGSRDIDIKKPFTLPRVDMLIHAAANPKVFLAREKPLEDFRLNALGTLHALEAMRFAGIRKIIYISTNMVYTSRQASKENDPAGPSNDGGPYGVSKLAGEQYVKVYASLYGLNYLILRPTSLYGPCMYKNAVMDLIRGFMERRPVKLYHHIDSLVDFLYIEDAAQAVCRGLDWADMTLNLGFGSGTSLRSIYGLLKGIFREDIPLQWSEERIINTVCAEKIKGLGWRPMVAIEEGLGNTVEFFRSNACRG